jgi:flagellar FliL protein
VREIKSFGVVSAVPAEARGTACPAHSAGTGDELILYQALPIVAAGMRRRRAPSLCCALRRAAMAFLKKKEKKAETEAEAPEKEEKGPAKKAPAAEEDEADEKQGEGEVKPKRKLSGKTLVLFIVLPLALIGAGLGAAFALGLFGGGKSEEADKQAQAEHASAKSVFFDLPELLVNINTNGGKESFLKLAISLELKDAEATKQLEAAMPRVVDSIQVFLRELRIDDLNGSAGILRLREELIKRIGAAAEPVQVRDVLFKEIIVQ